MQIALREENLLRMPPKKEKEGSLTNYQVLMSISVRYVVEIVIENVIENVIDLEGRHSPIEKIIVDLHGFPTRDVMEKIPMRSTYHWYLRRP